MTPKQLRDDLRGVLKGQVRVDETTRRLFATDASIFRMLPLGVVTPVDQEDLLKLVKYASERQLGLTARGGGTGLAGECLTQQLVVDLTAHFQKIVEVSDDTIQVQPGVVAQQVNLLLASRGRRLAIDCASEASCTIGGMLATNASGARVFKHGYLRQYVEAVQAVIGTGQAVTLKPQRANQQAIITAESQLADVLANLITQHESLIQTCLPKTHFNRAGYLLHDLMKEQMIALQRVLVGSEGTLGIITEAKLRTVPIPVERGVLLLGFASMQEAAELVPALLDSEPSAVELLDRRLITMACEAEPLFKRWLSPSMQVALLVEWESDEPGAMMPRIEIAMATVHRLSHPLVERLSVEPVEAEQLWSLRSKALPGLLASAKRTPVAFLEDMAVPVESLASFLVHVQQLLPRHNTAASVLSHAAAGIVHLRPLFDLHSPSDIKQLQALTEDVYAEVFRLGGTISAQHGVGLARAPWLPQQMGPMLDLFRQVKTLFDPAGIFNPGKILGGTGSPFQYLRAEPEVTSSEVLPADLPVSADDSQTGQKVLSLPVVKWQMNWSNGSVLQMAESCNGCGACRAKEPGKRMCPIYHAETHEAASPRAKANLLRDLLTHPEMELKIDAEAVRAVADLCVNCKMCGIECPSRVPIPQLMLEAKAQNVKEQGLRWRDWIVSHIDTWARWGSHWAWLVNGLLRGRISRWLLERLFGVARLRRLPRLHFDTFVNRARRYGWTVQPTEVDRPRVLYFVDTFGQYFDPEVAEAAVRVLQAAGVQVYVPPEALQSGAAALSVGHLERARRLAQRNINTLEPLTREGYTILCSEPTTAIMLKQDYLHLVDDPGAAQVARHTVELMTYLQQLDEQGRLPAATAADMPLTIGHHVPCHIKALQQGVHGPDLLQRSARYRVKTLDLSCSGMAGVYGLQKAHFASSLKAGQPILDRFSQEDLHVGSSECSSCRLQMQQREDKLVLHPVQWLALAYGLMPSLAERLRKGVVA
ncbi:MAG: FAD-linked oxidase C-terminal domain-containing protein [Gemmatales bacterium]